MYIIQCSAALENLEHILNIPKSVQDAMDLIYEGKLLAAHQRLLLLLLFLILLNIFMY